MKTNTAQKSPLQNNNLQLYDILNPINDNKLKISVIETNIHNSIKIIDCGKFILNNLNSNCTPNI